MEGLRWLLLAVGVVVIAGVYFYGRRESASADRDALPDDRVEPSFGATEDAPAAEAELEPSLPPVSVASETDAGIESGPPEAPEPREVPEPPGLQEPPAAASPADQKIVTLRIVARDRGAFRGDELILSLRGIGMRHGKFGIFHRYDGDADDNSVFSAASLVEPGSFDLSNIKDQAIPGISLFAVFPGPIPAVEAFDLMMAAARAIAKTMEADLLDESGSTLSIQRERYMREEIIAFEHARQIAG